MMRQGMNTLKTERTPSSQTQGVTGLGSMEEVPMVPNGGIQNIPDAAKMLADAGRYGAVYVVHASEGEPLIPEEGLEGEAGARIRESLYRQMRQMGADPERYVVGNSLNSINPDTGLPEFFFKKVFKKIKSFFKKAAPVILPIALNVAFPGLGTIANTAIGSGLGSLIQGGSAKDALKAAAFGGLTAGIASGVSGIISSPSGTGIGQGFLSGVQKGLPSKFGGVGLTEQLKGVSKSVFGDPTGSSVRDGVQNLDSEIYDSAFTTAGPHGPILTQGGTLDASVLATSPEFVPHASVAQPAIQDLRLTGGLRNRSFLPGQFRGEAFPSKYFDTGPGRLPGGNFVRDTKVSASLGTRANPVADYDVTGERYLRSVPESKLPQQAPNFHSKAVRDVSDNIRSGGSRTGQMEGGTGKDGLLPEWAKEYFPEWMGGTPDAVAQKSLVDARLAAYNNALAKVKVPNKELAQKIAMDVSGGSSLKKYLGPGILGAAAFTLGGGFEQPEQEDIVSGFVRRPIDEDLVAQNRINTGTYERRAPIQFSQFPVGVAYGGEMQDFPRRNGAISGPGTEKSDDIPAMLSDGEFVLTAKAVRGAGNGSRRQGVKNLYNIMRNFEASV